MVCEKDSAYCGDVDLYRADVVAECGSAALVSEQSITENQDEGGGGSTGNSEPGQSSTIQAEGEEHNSNEQEPPGSCAYFTRPANEKIRLNYHLPESTVCWNDSAYQCVTDSQGVKYWLKRAACSVYQGLPDACEIEGTC